MMHVLTVLVKGTQHVPNRDTILQFNLQAQSVLLVKLSASLQGAIDLCVVMHLAPG